MKNIYTTILVVILLIMSNSCKKTDYGNLDIDSEITKELNAKNIPSVVACIVDKNGISWTGNYGYSNIQEFIPVNNQSIFTLMSVTKVFVAITIMQLWEQDKIDLQADINNYLPFAVRNPNFPDKKITTYHLLTHTSGIAWPEAGDGIPDFDHFYINEEPPLIREWLPEYILPDGKQFRKKVWKSYAPGERYLYSNIATSLLGLIVEEISGLDFRDYCKENILIPLEMNNSAFRLNKLDPAFMVIPYDDSNRPMNYYTCRHYPAGFLNTNVEDFSNFAVACLNYGERKGKRILKKSSMEKMFEVQNTGSGHGFLWVNCLGDCIGKKGGGTGFATWAEWHHNNGTALFLFSNRRNEAVWPGGRIYDLVKYQCFRG